MSLKSTLVQQLARHNQTLTTFQMIVLRLLDRQVIYRLKSQQDRLLFDDYLVIQELVDEYLGLMGVRVALDERGGIIIAYPPGSSTPGIESEPQEAFGSLIQTQLGLADKGMLLCLRMLYENALRAGDLNDDGLAVTDLHDVYTRYHQIMKREMPTQASQRRDVFNAMKRLSVVYECGDVENSEALISITPVVEYLSLSSVVESLRRELSGEVAEAPASYETEVSEPERGAAPEALNSAANQPISTPAAVKPSLFADQDAEREETLHAPE